MRIAYLVSQFPAASHTFIRREVCALRAHGLDIHTFSVRRPSESERRSDEERTAYEETFYILPSESKRLLRAHAKRLLARPRRYAGTLALALRHRVPGLRAATWAMFHFAESMVLADELERHEVTHLHNHFANPAATVGLLSAHYLGLSWSVTLHGISETDYPAGVLLPKKLEAASFVACVSHFGRAQAMRIVAPEHWHKLFIVRCALDLSVMPLRAARTPDSPVRVICVARMAPEKGHVGLLQAFAGVRARGSQAELVLVGDGPERTRVEHYVNTLGLQDCVKLLGRLSERETLRAVAESDLLVLASFMEGLPVVLMEAMALGLPVIAPRVAGIPELIEEGDSGLMYAPANWEELTECLQRLLTDAELRQRLGRVGRKKIEAEFEINKAVEPLLARFKAVGG